MSYICGIQNVKTHKTHKMNTQNAQNQLVKRSIIEIIKQNCELDKTIKHQVNKKYHIEWLELDDTWSVVNSFGFGCFSSIDFEECKKVIKCILKA